MSSPAASGRPPPVDCSRVNTSPAVRPEVTLTVSSTHSAVVSYEHGWASVRCTVASTGSAASSAGSEALLSPDGHSTMRPSRVSRPSTTTATVRARSTVGVVDIDPSECECPCPCEWGAS